MFLHDSSGAQQETDGVPPLDNERFFSRLVQRLIHFLSMQTSSGRLYEVDTRLRPSGRSGLLVTSLEGFRHYQTQDAWVWEHQALLRSRALAGSEDVCRAFEAIRRDVLVAHVERAKLKTEVAKMRRSMRTELSLAKEGSFDMKQDPGGIADIEFLIDYWVLAHSARVSRSSSSFRTTFASSRLWSESGSCPPSVACDSRMRTSRCVNAFTSWRSTKAAASSRPQEFAAVRELVGGIWHEVFADVEGE